MKCPNCGSQDGFTAERSPEGKTHCHRCAYSAPHKEFQGVQHSENPDKMTEQDYMLLVKFINKQILTGVDGALRRAVTKMFRENHKLLERVVEYGGEQAKKEFWEKWE